MLFGGGQWCILPVSPPLRPVCQNLDGLSIPNSSGTHPGVIVSLVQRPEFSARKRGLGVRAGVVRMGRSQRVA